MYSILCAACAALLVSQSFSQVVINEVLYDPSGTDAGQERIELKNFGTGTIDLAGYDLYPDGIGYYTFSSLTLGPGACLVVHLRESGINSSTDVYHDTPTSNMGNSSGSVALFSSTSHSSSTLVSFVQWGAADRTWSGTAVSAGHWTSTADYAPAVLQGHSLEYDGSGTGSTDWFNQSSPTIGMDNALPVTWISFTVRKIDEGVEVLWRTAEEPDNFGFRIERRSMGADQTPAWQPIGFVEAQRQGGGSPYRFLDREAPAERCAYRLCQIDHSGTSSMSGAVEIDLTARAEGKLSGYPNPFNPTLKIEFQPVSSGRMKVEVFDLRGARVGVVFDGVVISGRSYSREFNAGALPSGTYIVRSVGGGNERALCVALVR